MEQEHKQLVIGILAHVDSGKTTLSEALLYGTGTIRKLGRVDHKDAFLDTDALEKARGIILETLASLPFLSKIKKTSVVLDSFGDSSVNLGVWVWIPVMTKSSSLSTVRERIYNAFNEHGISIPFPQQDLYVKEFPDRQPGEEPNASPREE